MNGQMALGLEAALLGLAGFGWLTLLGAAGATLLLPRSWRPLACCAAPHLGWALLVTIGYPLNAAWPFRTVVPVLASLAGVALVVQLAWGLRRGLPAPRTFWSRLWPLCREGAVPLLVAAASYAAAAGIFVRQGTLSTLVADSDVEHFADVIAALLHAPIGWSIGAQQGLEATPVGLAYHYVHASLAALTGIDVFTTAVPAGCLMLALAVPAVYLFCRTVLRLGLWGARLATVLYALGALPLVVVAFGWGQQTAALAAVPFGLAALEAALREGSRPTLVLGGLAGALAGGSLYLATAPLVAGAAIALGAGAWYASSGAGSRHARARQVVARLAAVAAVATLAGALSHASAVAFLLGRLQAGLLRADELAGRSSHVATFASPAVALGVAPLDLVRSAAESGGRVLLAWSPPRAAVAVAALAGAGLVVLGLGTAARAPAMLGVLAVTGLYEAYLRFGRPFPYGEFKLLTSVWFLVPCLAAAGAAWLAQPGRLAAVRRAAAAALLATFAAGLVAAHLYLYRFLALPWGAALPEVAMHEARAVVAAVPPGQAVFVSNQLTPPAALRWHGEPTGSRAGFPSAEAAKDSLSKRWRGILTSLLAFSGRPVYGLVQRHSTELRAPVDPAAVDYVLLDAREDPQLYGLLPEDRVAGGATLALYRQPHRLVVPEITIPELTEGDELASPVDLRIERASEAVLRGPGGMESVVEWKPPALPPAVLPIGESLPGRFGRERLAPAAAVPAEPPGGEQGAVVIGFQALAPVHVVVEAGDAAGAAVRRVLALGPGLTWYTTPLLRWPARVSLAAEPATPPPSQDRAGDVLALAAADIGRLPGEPVLRMTNAVVVPEGSLALHEDLVRSPSGTDWPLVSVGAQNVGGAVQLELWYSAAETPPDGIEAALRESARLWLDGRPLPEAPSLPPLWAKHWVSRVKIGSSSAEQPAGGGASKGEPAAEAEWLWLELGEPRGASVAALPLAQLARAGSAPGLLWAAPAAYVLPMLARPVAPAPPQTDDGTLVKGSGDDLFYVDHGRLRWVPSAAVLERRQIPWRLVQLSDEVLWRLPQGLPLD